MTFAFLAARPLKIIRKCWLDLPKNGKMGNSDFLMDEIRLNLVKKCLRKNVLFLDQVSAGIFVPTYIGPFQDKNWTICF